MAKELNEMQAKFAAEYIIDFNATKAAERAGYSKKSAGSQGHDLLKIPEIQQAIAKEQKKREKRTNITQDRVLLEIARLAFSDMRQAFNEDGVLKGVHEWPDDVAAAISSIKVVENTDKDGTVIGQTKEVKFWDKPKNLELLGKHLRMFIDRVAVGGDEDLPPVSFEQKKERLMNLIGKRKSE